MSWYHRLLSLFSRERLTITLKGEKRDGGYYYLKSSDLPGFTFLITPDEARDIEKLSEAIKPALNAYMIEYFKFRNRQIAEQTQLCISYADLRGSSAGKRMKFIAELCNP